MELIRPRTADFKIKYEDRDITDDIRRDVCGISYTDSASDASDSLSVSISALDSKWLNGWLPDKGTKLNLTMLTQNWEKAGDHTYLDCGVMTIDDLGFSDSPDTLTIGAVARPNETDFHERDREFTWKNTTIRRIAETIAERYELECELDAEAEDVDIALKEQDGKDSAFLQELCSTYGLILKIYSKKLWIYDREKYKAHDSAGTIDRIDMNPGSVSWNTTLAGGYTGGRFTYTNQKKKIDIKVEIGQGPRTKTLNQYASSEADARRQLAAAIANANHGLTRISFSTMGNLRLCSAQCVDITGLGRLDGKYFIDEVTHKLSRSGGLVSSFSCSKIESEEQEHE